MRIFYLTFSSTPRSVTQKINAQSDELRRQGIFTKILIINTEKFDTKYLNKYFLFKHFSYWIFIRNKLKKFFKKLGNGDIVYIRGEEFFLPYFPIIFFFKGKRKFKIISEYQTFEFSQAMVEGDYFFAFHEIMFGKILRRCYNGIIGVTEEITEYEQKIANSKNIPSLTLGNGINVDSVPIRKINIQNFSEINMVCVAMLNTWHGLDRLIEGMALYEGPESVYLNIVGEGKEIAKIMELSIQKGIENRVVYHDYLTGEPLNAIIGKSHLGVGSLAIHRKGLNYTSELKNREYCARGLPWISSAFDSDFSTDFEYFLKIPNNESPVDVGKSIQFIKRMYDDPQHPLRMHEYAKKNLDWSIKIKKLVNFLSSLE